MKILHWENLRYTFLVMHTETCSICTHAWMLQSGGASELYRPLFSQLQVDFLEFSSSNTTTHKYQIRNAPYIHVRSSDLVNCSLQCIMCWCFKEELQFQTAFWLSTPILFTIYSFFFCLGNFVIPLNSKIFGTFSSLVSILISNKFRFFLTNPKSEDSFS